MQDWHDDSESGEEESAGAEILQSSSGGEAHFQQEQCEDALEHAFEDRLDGFPAFSSDGCADDEATDQQHGRWCAEEFMADGEESGTGGIRAGLIGGLLCHLESSDGQCDLNPGNFQQCEQSGHESFGGGSRGIGELLCCDEGDGGNRSVVSSDAGCVGNTESAEASEYEVGGDRSEAAEQQSDGSWCCKLRE